jgi:hypothetical protein|tara:strand:+ start:3944 stop:4132 length:189 start_codon:yes stop_codon:yes gene_type:complete
MMDEWRIWLGRLGAACGIIGSIIGFDSSTTWKLGASGWFTGGIVAALLAIVMHLDHAAAKKQ